MKLLFAEIEITPEMRDHAGALIIGVNEQTNQSSVVQVDKQLFADIVAHPEKGSKIRRQIRKTIATNITKENNTPVHFAEISICTISPNVSILLIGIEGASRRTAILQMQRDLYKAMPMAEKLLLRANIAHSLESTDLSRTRYNAYFYRSNFFTPVPATIEEREAPIFDFASSKHTKIMEGASQSGEKEKSQLEIPLEEIANTENKPDEPNNITLTDAEEPKC